MATETKLRQLAEQGCAVYYFYSSERYLVRRAVAAASQLLAAGEDEETTVLDGATPGIEQLIMAAGTISFFGTRRVVVLPEIDPSAYSDKDLDELCETLGSLENAVVVLGTVFDLERNKLKLGKRAQKLINQCKKLGFTEELAKPKPYELKIMMIERAKEQGTNLPEGAAISLPLRQEGFSRFRSFVYGMLSGIVEPVFGILVVLAAGSIQPLMPWLLSFAAGAMMYVVVEELIPEAHLGEHSNVGTLGVMGGFLVMMVLDVALG